MRSLIVILCTVAAVLAEVVEISVIFNAKTNTYQVLDYIDDYYGDAYGYFNRNYNNSGWNTLDVFMQEEVDAVEDHLTYAKSMGYLEGYVTCTETKLFWNNFYSAVFGTDVPGEKTISFLQENYKWMQANVEKYADTDDYWYTVRATLQQLNGLLEGFVAGCGSSSEPLKAGENIYATLDHPTLEHFLMINAWGDLYQISSVFAEPGMNSRIQGNKKTIREKSLGGKKRLSARSEDLKLIERCSALIKLLPGYSDVVYGHNTWDSFESLGPRILKHYNFPLMRGGFAEHHYDVYFSSSPALLSSIDDFFTVSGYAQLGVMETTNEIYNASLLSLVTPASVLSWQRSVASNQLATSGAHWGETFSRYHSGTYTNQWMALDLNLFTPGSAPKPGFLTVFEEVPGLVHVEDQTAALIRDTYWASYNIPFYSDINQASGYAAICKRDAEYCHDTASRANIFRQYQSKVTDVESGKWMLDYNSWQTDAASLDDSCNSIACRGDLEKKIAHRGAFGALDAKVTTAVDSKRYPGNAPIINARLGPTNDQQPVFCWSKFADEADYSHVAQPDCFDFGWTTFPHVYSKHPATK